jgi:hypothetical protein
VFASYGQLASDDTDAAKDVYRFDAVTGTLERVSIGENGYNTNGNDGGLNGNSEEVGALILSGHFGGSIKWQYEMDNRMISEDGSRIIFTTADRLSPAATNGLVNVYEWHENANGIGGVTSLISGGSGSTAVEDAVMAPGGRDVFFVTSQDLVPQDVDGVPDVYDARLGGGFAPLPAAPEPCSGDACQGPLTNPAPLLVPSSVSQSPGENFAAPLNISTKPKAKKNSKHRKKAKRKKAKRKARSSSRVRPTGGVAQLRRSK